MCILNTAHPAAAKHSLAAVLVLVLTHTHTISPPLSVSPSVCLLLTHSALQSEEDTFGSVCFGRVMNGCAVICSFGSLIQGTDKGIGEEDATWLFFFLFFLFYPTPPPRGWC